VNAEGKEKGEKGERGEKGEKKKKKSRRHPDRCWRRLGGKGGEKKKNGKKKARLVDQLSCSEGGKEEKIVGEKKGKKGF